MPDVCINPCGRLFYALFWLASALALLAGSYPLLPPILRSGSEANLSERGLSGLARQLAHEQGIDCREERAFFYTDRPSVAAELNEWIQAVKLRYRSLEGDTWRADWEESGVVGQWMPGPAENVLLLCSGPLLARTSTETGSSAAGREVTEEEPTRRRRGLHIGQVSLMSGALVAGLLGVGNMFRRRQERLDRESEARWRDDNWKGPGTR